MYICMYTRTENVLLYVAGTIGRVLYALANVASADRIIYEERIFCILHFHCQYMATSIALGAFLCVCVCVRVCI